jgi:hypothetical protein
MTTRPAKIDQQLGARELVVIFRESRAAPESLFVIHQIVEYLPRHPAGQFAEPGFLGQPYVKVVLWPYDRPLGLAALVQRQIVVVYEVQLGAQIVAIGTQAF